MAHLPVSTLQAVPEAPHPVLEKYLKQQKILPQSLGYWISEIKSKDQNPIQHSFQPKKLFVPASTTKILSTYFALKTLGENHRFQTELRYRGVKKNNEILGDLILVGDGDPLLDAAELHALAHQLNQNNIQKIAGKFLYNDSKFFHSAYLDPNGEKDETYNPGISALSASFNRFFFTQIGSPNRNSGFETIPKLPHLQLKRGTSQKHPWESFAWVDDEKTETWIAGTGVRYPRFGKLPIRNTSLFTAEFFRDFATKNSINLPSPEPDVTGLPSEPLAQVLSPPLHEIAQLCLEYSNNLLAELLMINGIKILYSEKQILSIDQSSEWMLDWFKTKFPEIDWNGAKLHSGSGISPENQISPEQLGQLVRIADLDKDLKKPWISLLPSSGWSGSMDHRLNETRNTLRVWAKTGSLDYSTGLSGIFYTKNNKKFAFAILQTDFDSRRMVTEKENVKTVQNLKANAGKWSQKRKSLEDWLLRQWIENDGLWSQSQ